MPTSQKEEIMDYIPTIKNIRNILFTAFLINVVIVIVCWLFVLTDLMRYFMWMMPGFSIETANEYIMFMVGIMHIASIVLFFIPAIALSIEIPCARRREAREQAEWAAFQEKMFGEMNAVCACAQDIKPTKAKSKSASKKKK